MTPNPPMSLNSPSLTSELGSTVAIPLCLTVSSVARIDGLSVVILVKRAMISLNIFPKFWSVP